MKRGSWNPFLANAGARDLARVPGGCSGLVHEADDDHADTRHRGCRGCYDLSPAALANPQAAPTPILSRTHKFRSLGISLHVAHHRQQVTIVLDNRHKLDTKPTPVNIN